MLRELPVTDAMTQTTVDRRQAPALNVASALLAALLILAPAAAQDGKQPFRWPEGFERSHVERNNMSYNVHGATPDQVWASIREVGPKDSNGRRFAGWTQWHISWYVRYERDAAGCRLGEAHVRTRISMTLPVWADRGAASPDLQQSWDQFITALARHEEGHASLSVERAGVIERGLTALPAKLTCEAALEDGRTYFSAQMADLAKVQAEYDRTTSHGLTQGVAFPVGLPGGGRPGR